MTSYIFCQTTNVCVFFLVMSLYKTKMSDAFSERMILFIKMLSFFLTNPIFFCFSCVSDITLIRICVKLLHCEVCASSHFFLFSFRCNNLCFFSVFFLLVVSQNSLDLSLFLSLSFFLIRK